LFGSGLGRLERPSRKIKSGKVAAQASRDEDAAETVRGAIGFDAILVVSRHRVGSSCGRRSCAAATDARSRAIAKAKTIRPAPIIRLAASMYPRVPPMIAIIGNSTAQLSRV
jgi:hypothetical protein